MKGGNILHHMRRLGALVDRQPRLGDIPVGDHRAQLQGHAGVAAKEKIRLHHFVGIGKGLGRPRRRRGFAQKRDCRRARRE